MLGAQRQLQRTDLDAAAEGVAGLNDSEAVWRFGEPTDRQSLRPGLLQIRHCPEAVRACQRDKPVPVDDAVGDALGRRLGAEREAARQLLPMHAVHVHLPAHGYTHHYQKLQGRCAAAAPRRSYHWCCQGSEKPRHIRLARTIYKGRVSCA